MPEEWPYMSQICHKRSDLPYELAADPISRRGATC